eukprot:6949288-Prorocentrum_lima.AAC.1
MRAHIVHDLVSAHLICAQHVASQDNAADALTKGSGAYLIQEGQASSLLDRVGAMHRIKKGI